MSGPLWPVLVLSHVCLSSPVGFRAIFQDVLPPGPCMDDQHILHTQLKHHVLLNFLPQGAVSVELCLAPLHSTNQILLHNEARVFVSLQLAILEDREQEDYSLLSLYPQCSAGTE